MVGNVLSYENDCLGNASGNYRTKQTYSYDNLYQLIKADGETTYNPYQSSVPEFVSTYSQSFSFDTDGLGNMASKVSTETVTPQKSIGDNLNYSFAYNYDKNYAHRLINAGGRYYKYDANGNIVCEQDGSFESNGEEVSYHKINRESDDVYSTDYGWGLFKEDDKGGSGKANRTKYKRTHKWNERNQLISSVDSNYNTAYIYGQDGQRSNKYTQNSETLYFNKMWTLHTDSGNNVYGGQSAKNIYLGETRIVTKLNSGTNPTYQEEYYKQYYYHSDHLGSASLISDYKGDEYQRIEYTPYGETWVEKTSNTGLEWLPYKFTAKELDEETGLYYYGARYLNPKYSMWISTDPALGEYLSDSSKGEGGVYNHINLNLYHYAGNNPIRYTDPNGKSAVSAVLFALAVKYVVDNMPSKEEHYNRNDNQSQFSFSRIEDAEKAGFTQLGTNTGEDPEDLDNCHENGLGVPNPSGNNKYTMADGKGGSYELVYDSNGNLVTDEVNKGTYNYADPKGLKGKMDHGVKDLLPYLIFGNSKDDPTTFGERLMGTLNSPFGKYNKDVNLTPEEANKIRIQEQQRTKEAALERYNGHH